MIALGERGLGRLHIADNPVVTSVITVCKMAGSASLVELSQQARDLIDGVSPTGIKKNDVMRQKIKKEKNELKFAIDAAIEDMPRRKIRMAS